MKVIFELFIFCLVEEKERLLGSDTCRDMKV